MTFLVLNVRHSVTVLKTLCPLSDSDWNAVPLVANSTNYLVKSLEPDNIYRFQLAALLGPDELACSNLKKGKTLGWNPRKYTERRTLSYFLYKVNYSINDEINVFFSFMVSLSSSLSISLVLINFFYAFSSPQQKSNVIAIQLEAKTRHVTSELVNVHVKTR